MNGIGGALALGAGFGIATSLSNALASQYTVHGSQMGGHLMAGAAEVTSLVLGAGWAWAALAVLAGYWLGRTPALAGVVGSVVLIAATVAYYASDHVVRAEPFALYQSELLFWSLGSVVCGALLGAVGAGIRRRGVVGLLATLTVPVGAVVQMWLLPPGGGDLTSSSATTTARLIVCLCAVLIAAFALRRFRATTGGTEHPRRAQSSPDTQEDL